MRMPFLPIIVIPVCIAGFAAGLAMAQTSGGVAQSGHFSRFANPRSGEAATRVPDTSVEPCAMVAIWRDGVATVDWACVDSFAAKWSPDSKSDSTTAWAYALKAVRDGKARP